MKGNTSHTSHGHSRFILMLATCKYACRAHNRVYTVQSRRTMYPGSTPGSNPWFSSITMFYGLYPLTTSRAALSAQTVRQSVLSRSTRAARAHHTVSKDGLRSPRSTQVTLNFARLVGEQKSRATVRSLPYSQHRAHSDSTVSRGVISGAPLPLLARKC